jgi:aspartate-semialdehyde dehydrogenase
MSAPAGRLPVAVLGATGQVGQRFLSLLAGHPWFEVRAVTASPGSAGRRYAEAVRWTQTTPIPEEVRDLVLAATEPAAAGGCALAFSALDSAAAAEAELRFASAGATVVSNASSHRMDPDVPLVVPEVNPDHLDLAQLQRHGGGGSGRGVILTNPNCSTIGLVLALAPLDRAFGVERVHAVTLQAVSGAGFPGVPSLLAIDNVVPFIAGEEAKVESEPRKILGRFTGEAIEPHPLTVSASCNRVPVVDGHTLCVSVELTRPPSLDAVREAWRSFRGAPQELGLPSAPEPPIVVLDGDDAPQPRLHRDLGGGMAVSVGRLRPCPLLDLRFVALSHNTVRGAAGGAILLAELAVARGLVGSAP